MIYELTHCNYLRSHFESDVHGLYQSWFENQEVCKYNLYGKLFKNTSWFREFYEHLNREDQAVWAICYQDDSCW